MKLASWVTSMLVLVILLAGCANQFGVTPTVPVVTETITALPTQTLSVALTGTISPTDIPPSSATPEMDLTRLPPLSLPEFNARYSTRDLALTPDKQVMAVIARDRMYGEESVWLWDVNALEKSLAAYQNEGSDLDSIAFSFDGNKLAIGREGMIVILDWKTGESLENIVFPIAGSRTVEISFGANNTLLSSHHNGQLTVWDLATKEAKYSVALTAGPGLFSSFTLSPDGTTLVTGMHDETNLWDFKTGQLKEVVRPPGYTDLTSFVYSLDGKWVATGGCNEFGFEMCTGGQVLIWNSSFENPSIIVSNYPSNIGELEFSPNGNSLAVLSSGGLELLDLGTGQSTYAPTLAPAPGKIPHVERVHTFDITFLADGNEMAVSTTEGIQLLDVNAMSWAPNLRFILSLGYFYSIAPAGDNLNFRTEASTNSGITTRLQTGESFQVIDGPKIVDDQIWWNVKINDGTKGWIVEMPGWYEFVP